MNTKSCLEITLSLARVWKKKLNEQALIFNTQLDSIIAQFGSQWKNWEEKAGKLRGKGGALVFPFCFIYVLTSTWLHVGVSSVQVHRFAKTDPIQPNSTWYVGSIFRGYNPIRPTNIYLKYILYDFVTYYFAPFPKKKDPNFFSHFISIS